MSTSEAGQTSAAIREDTDDRSRPVENLPNLSWRHRREIVDVDARDWGFEAATLTPPWLRRLAGEEVLRAGVQRSAARRWAEIRCLSPVRGSQLRLAPLFHHREDSAVSYDAPVPDLELSANSGIDLR
jgi:hypothetical protein